MLYFKSDFDTQVLHVLIIHFGWSLYIPCQLYFWYVFNKLYPGWLNMGAHQIPGESVTVCAWGHSFPTPWRVDESIHFSLHTLSKHVCTLYQVHACKFLPKREWHHWGIMWWCQAPYDDILVIRDISDDDIYISIKGVYKEECISGRGVPSFSFIE